MIFEKLQQIIVDELGVEASEVTLTASISDDLGADSLDAVELIMAIEDEFDILFEFFQCLYVTQISFCPAFSLNQS